MYISDCRCPTTDDLSQVAWYDAHAALTEICDPTEGYAPPSALVGRRIRADANSPTGIGRADRTIPPPFRKVPR
jgi:hypothetical protein